MWAVILFYEQIDANGNALGILASTMKADGRGVTPIEIYQFAVVVTPTTRRLAGHYRRTSAAPPRYFLFP